jgi:RNase H-fold protein (predicted Holliday junction resolvase)
MSPSENNFIGIDYGTKKTGLAYSVGSFAFGWKTVPT